MTRNLSLCFMSVDSNAPNDIAKGIADPATPKVSTEEEALTQTRSTSLGVHRPKAAVGARVPNKTRRYVEFEAACIAAGTARIAAMPSSCQFFEKGSKRDISRLLFSGPCDDAMHRPNVGRLQRSKHVHCGCVPASGVSLSLCGKARRA